VHVSCFFLTFLTLKDMKEKEEEEEWTTLRAGEGRKKDGEEKNNDENENDDENCVKIASVSEAIDACLHSFESRAKMYAEVKLAHRKVLEGLRRDASSSSSTTTTDEKHSSPSSSSFSVEYETSLAVFASNMNALNAKLKRVLHFLEEDKEEEDKEEDEKRVVLLLLKSVQEQEKEKLRLTAIEMALKTHYEMKKWTWQQDGYVEEEEEEKEEEKENASTKLKPSWATHVAGEKNDAYEGLRNCCEQAPEPTKVEFENAMKETTMGLEKCIQTINDARDELLEIKASFLTL
jgi:hypothetical protein